MSEKIVLLELRCAFGSGGGPEKTILLIPHYLDPQRYRVVIVYLRDKRPLSVTAKEKHPACKYIEIIEKSKLSFKTFRLLKNIIKEERISLIHGHEYKSNFWALILSRIYKIPAITTVHAWLDEDWKMRLYNWFDRRMLKFFDHVIAVSDPTYNEAMHYGVQEKKLTLIYNSVDSSFFLRQSMFFTDSASVIKIGYAGRIAKKKNLKVLIKACAKLIEAGVHCQIHILGEGDERVKLEKFAQVLGIEKEVHWHGYQSDVRPFFDAIDIFVLPSYIEGLANVLLEAMAFSLPCVVSEIDGNKILLRDGIEGLLFNPDDAETLVCHLKSLINNPQEAQRLGLNARKRVVQDFDIEKRFSKFREVLEKVNKIQMMNIGRERDENISDKIVLLELRSAFGSGGGPEKTILLTPYYLDPQRYRVVIVYLRDERPLSVTTKEKHPACKYIEIIEKSKLSFKTFRLLRDIIKEERISLIHGHEHKSNFWALILSKIYKIPTITTVHGWIDEDWKMRFYNWFDRRMLRFFKHVNAVSRATFNEAVSYGVHRDKLTLIYNAVDCSYFSRQQVAEINDHKVTRIGYAGRIVEEKNLQVTLGACASLKKSGICCQLHILGEGPFRNSLELLARTLDFEKDIVWHGYQSDVKLFYEKIDIFVLSSFKEGLSNVLLEAMAFSLPCVVSNIDGNRDLINDGIDGLLFEPNDVFKLENYLKTLINNPQEAQRLGLNARRRVKQDFDIRMRFERFRKVVDNVVN